jgi:hypothetical protein
MASHSPNRLHYQYEIQAAASFITPVLITTVYLLVTMNGLLQESQRASAPVGQTERLRTLITSYTTLLRIFPVSTTNSLKMGDKTKSLTSKESSTAAAVMLTA